MKSSSSDHPIASVSVSRPASEPEPHGATAPTPSAGTGFEPPSPSDATRTSQRTLSRGSLPQIDLPVSAQLRDPKRYHILGEHGRGGLGRVSRAHDVELGRDIAIKELISRTHVGEIRFLREALITARLEHPSIVPVHEAGRWPDGTPFYAMKLVAGRPLRDLIAERPTIDERIGLLHHVIAVADAIAYAHRRNIIHRDLKPSNVIVGDFGETVVIDWGLAKDLTASEETASGPAPFRISHDDGLTSAGTILGTPAYMAPEQARGEPVDQRADVFAIGAMLWELCSLSKLPPAYAGQRRRILSRSGIDPDLATIVEKAVDPDPRHRYSDAAALAADMRAFKAGARISARRYSVWSILTHWIRRHLAFSSAVLALLACFTGGVAFYVYRIADERDRTDAALARSEEAKASLTLEHAELLLRGDPTAAVAALATYGGPDSNRVRQIRAEAAGRGVAQLTLNVHSNSIVLLAGMPDGAILSVGEDRRIVVTKNNLKEVVAQDVATPVVTSYSEAAKLLVYSSTNLGAVLLDVPKRQSTRISTAAVWGFAFSRDGARLALVDAEENIVVWGTAEPRRLLWKRHFPQVGPVQFIDNDRIIVSTPPGFAVLSLRGSKDYALAVQAEAFSTSDNRLVIGDAQGMIHIYAVSTFRLEGSVRACRDRVQNVEISPNGTAFMFACHEGSAGVGSLDPVVSIRDRFPTEGPALQAKFSDDGHSAVVLSASNIAYVHSLDSGLTSHYEGQSRLSCASAPSSEYPLFLTGDNNGSIRAWKLQNADARVLLQIPAGALRTAVSPDGSLVAVGSSNGSISMASIPDNKRETKAAHAAAAEGAFFLPGGLLVTYGIDGRALVWRTDNFTIIRRFAGHRSRIEDVDSVESGHAILSVGDDGRLLRWSPSGDDVNTLFTSKLPLINLETIAIDDTAVISDSAGSVWCVRPEGTSFLLRRQDGDPVTLLRASRSGRLVAIGTANGTVTVFESTHWRAVHSFQMLGTVGPGTFSFDDKTLAVVSAAREVRLLYLDDVSSASSRGFSLDARDISFSRDGRLLAITCNDGGTWFYAVQSERWEYVRYHYALASYGRFSSDNLFVSSDVNGQVVVRNPPEEL